MAVNATVTKKVRMTPAEARHLARLARRRRTTESAILRRGIGLVERMERRREGIEGLIALIGKEKEPPKIRWSLRP